MKKSELLQTYYSFVIWVCGALLYSSVNPILSDLIIYYSPSKLIKYLLMFLLFCLSFFILFKVGRKCVILHNMIKHQSYIKK